MATSSKIMGIDELAAKVIEGTRKAVRKMAEAAAANDENLIIGDKEGNSKSIPAKELLKTLSK